MAVRTPRALRALAIAAIVGASLFAPATAGGATGDAKAAAKKAKADDAAPRELVVPGHAKAFYYPPSKGTGKRVILWLHGRGAHVADDCAKWAPVARRLGWLLCPQGDEDRGGGARGWANNAELGRENVAKALAALRKKSKNAIEPGKHVLIGFSEGAFVAMQLGVHEAPTWSRWLILAANDGYWLGDGVQRLREQRRHLRRVVLLTGASDEVVAETRRTFAILEHEKVTAKLVVPADLGHEVPGSRMGALYTYPLRWLLGLENDTPAKKAKKKR
jgi:predicted esterase